MMHSSLPFSSVSGLDYRESSFGKSIESLHICCARSRAAAQQELHCTAHHWFQKALASFECAHSGSWGDSDDLFLWQHCWQLSRARHELDECAALIYTEKVALESGSWLAVRA